MKTRATSFLLAALAVVNFVLPAVAADPDELPLEPLAELEEIEGIEETEEIEEARSAVLLDGEPADSVEYEMRGGVCYVTVRSFVSLMDAEAMVEEENGTVSVNTTTVIEVVALDSSAAQSEDAEEPEDAGEAEEPEAAGEAEEAEETEGNVQSIENAANVVTADLNLTAAAGASYLVANGRYLYAQNGLITINDCVAAPVRLLARVYNLSVDYDGENEQVLLAHQEGAEPYLADGSETYDGDALYWLSHIINAESGNQPLEGKIAVGNVVMNRVKDPRFPDNIYDVLFQKYQFGPASSGSIYRDPNWESVVAAMLVLDGAEVTPTALFFNGVRAKAPSGRAYVTTIADHKFYK